MLRILKTKKILGSAPCYMPLEQKFIYQWFIRQTIAKTKKGFHEISPSNSLHNSEDNWMNHQRNKTLLWEHHKRQLVQYTGRLQLSIVGVYLQEGFAAAARLPDQTDNNSKQTNK